LPVKPRGVNAKLLGDFRERLYPYAMQRIAIPNSLSQVDTSGFHYLNQGH
jgi:hypothetical protein